MKKLISILAVLLFLFVTSCKTGSGFASRHYSPGRYIAKVGKHKSPKHKESNVVVVAPPKVTKKTDSENLIKAEYEAKANGDVSVLKQKQNSVEESLAKEEENSADLSHAKKHGVNLSLIKQFTPSAQIENAIKLLNKKRSGSGSGSSSMDFMSIISLVFSLGGLVVVWIAYFASIILEEFSPLFALGMILAVVGLVLGLISLIRSKKRDSSTTSKILSIVGLALGGIAVIVGAYLMLMTLLILSGL